MKKIVLLLVCFLPVMGIAQDACDFFEEVDIKVEKTNINTVASDFGPSIVKDNLWFSAFTQEEIEKISRGSSKDGPTSSTRAPGSRPPRPWPLGEGRSRSGSGFGPPRLEPGPSSSRSRASYPIRDARKTPRSSLPTPR